ncbi:MAG TPA: Uma2 family endonuclease, partial [Thermomicrobiales bacterium]|nr:Uma2 family endonuclease [Thermomicrobiales bacterium]
MSLTKPTGAWTYDDLLAMPDDGKRYEIIEGTLYELPRPLLVQAQVISNLIGILLPLVARLGGRWFTAPLDVFIPGGDPVQPDLIVLLPGGAAKPVRRGIEGPPDLAIEVLSPSNRGHDRLTKRALYDAAGVREYWIVDPEARTVEILALHLDAFHALQTARAGDRIESPLLPTLDLTAAVVFAGLDA